MSKEEEYITDENDPTSVEKINENNSISIIENEPKVEWDEVIGGVNIKSTEQSLLKHDMNMNLKVFQALKDGTLK